MMDYSRELLGLGALVVAVVYTIPAMEQVTVMATKSVNCATAVIAGTKCADGKVRAPAIPPAPDPM